MTQANQGAIHEKIEIGGKKYLRSGLTSGASDEIKKPGSFINILANSLSAAGMGPGKSVSFWR